MNKSFNKVPFVVFQNNCSERHFDYMGSSGKFRVSCHDQGCHSNSCDVLNCPFYRDKIGEGKFKPFSFDEFQSICNKREFKKLFTEDSYYVTCMKQEGDQNRCNHRQCPVWNNLNTFLESKQEVLNEEEKEETMEMISVESYESSDCILSLRDLNSRLRK